MTSRSCDDPIFWLLHSFVDFQYALWQDCRDYEKTDKDDITTRIYSGSSLDEELEFGALEEQSEVGSWRPRPYALS